MNQANESGDGVDPQSKARWEEEIRRGAIGRSRPELKSIVDSMRRFSGQRDRGEITVQKYRKLAMDLICQAISFGAFGGPKWRSYLTKLADDPSFENAATLFGIESSSRIVGATQDGKRFTDDGTWEISCHIDDFANEIGSSHETVRPGSHPVTIYEAGKPPLKTTSDKLPPRRTIKPATPGTVGISGPTLNHHAENISRLPKNERLIRIADLVENGWIQPGEITLLERLAQNIEEQLSPTGHSQNIENQIPANQNPQNEREGKPPKNVPSANEHEGIDAKTVVVLSAIFGGGFDLIFYVIADTYGSHGQPQKQDLFRYFCIVTILTAIRFSLWKILSRPKTLWFLYVVMCILFGRFIYEISGGTMSATSNPTARFIWPSVLTAIAFGFCVMAAHSWYWVATSTQRTGTAANDAPSQPEKAATPSATSQPVQATPDKIPVVNPTTRPPASRPTTPPGPDTRSQLQIFRGDAPPIDSLYYAEFGHGAKVDLTQWVDITDRGEKLVDWVKTLLHEIDPVKVSPETLHIGRDFLPGSEKVLTLYFCGGLRFTFEEKEYLSVAAIRKKLKRNINSGNPGFAMRVKINLGHWRAGELIHEFDVIRGNTALLNNPELYFDDFSLRIEKGQVEIIG
jgi:hypothetical protein